MRSLAAENDKVCAITAAMVHGTGLAEFKEQYPDRCFDVGIAEGHAVSMAGGLAKQGAIPVVAVYSTFLQRAYDMILQDVSMLNLHTVFAIDRAGLVGNDGETHHGVFDVGFLRSVPKMQVLCPANQKELEIMLRKAVFEMDGPVAVRYPRGGDGMYTACDGKELLTQGSDITLVGYGTLINELLQAAEILKQQGISAEVVKLGCIKPLNLQSVITSVRKTKHLLVAEECADSGCVGHEISTALVGETVKIGLRNLGDGFVQHGSVKELYELMKLDAASIAKAAREVLGK